MRIPRRRCLAALSGLAAATAGCLSPDGPDCSDPWSPGIEGEEPTLAPGGSTTVEVVIERATGVSLGVPSVDGEHVLVDVAGATIIPSPDGQADSYPPIWFWDACTGVTVRVPVEVAPDAEPGEYAYSVRAMRSHDGDREEATREFAVTVTPGAGSATPDST